MKTRKQIVVSIFIILCLVSILNNNMKEIYSNPVIMEKGQDFNLENVWQTNISSVILNVGEDISDITVKNSILNDTLSGFVTFGNNATENNLEVALTYFNHSGTAASLVQFMNTTIRKNISVTFGPLSHEIPVTYNSTLQYQSFLSQMKRSDGHVLFMQQILGYLLRTNNETFFGISSIPEILNAMVSEKILRFTSHSISNSYTTFDMSVSDQTINVNLNYHNLPLLFQTEENTLDIATEMIVNGNIPSIYMIFDEISFNWQIIPISGTIKGYELVLETTIGNINALVIKEAYDPDIQWKETYQENIILEYTVPDYIKEIIGQDTYTIDLGTFSFYLADQDILNRLDMFNAELAIFETNTPFSNNPMHITQDNSSISYNENDAIFFKTCLEGYDIWQTSTHDFNPVEIVMNDFGQYNNLWPNMDDFPFTNNIDWITDSMITNNNPQLKDQANQLGIPVHDQTNLKFAYGDYMLQYHFQSWLGHEIKWYRHQQLVSSVDTLSKKDLMFTSWPIFESIIAVVVFLKLDYPKKKTKIH